MAYYLRVLGDGSRYVAIAIPNPASNSGLPLQVECEIEFEAFCDGSDLPILTAANGGSSNLVFITSANQLEVRTGVDPSLFGLISGSRADWHNYRIRTTYNGVVRNRKIFIDGVEKASANISTTNYASAALFPLGSSTRSGGLRFLKYTDYVDPLNSRFYDPSASSGAGSVLIDSANSQNGALQSFPTNGSQWVYYSSGSVVSRVAAGGLLSSGSVSAVRSKVGNAGGGLFTSGVSGFCRVRSAIAQGGFSLSGLANAFRAKKYQAFGGVGFGGQLLATKLLSRSAGGGLSASGMAEFVLVNPIFQPPVIIAGSADLFRCKSVLSLGGLSVAGAAVFALIRVSAGSALLQKLDRPSQVYDAILNSIELDLIVSGRSDIEVKDYEDWGPDHKSDRCILIEFSDIEIAQKQNDGRHAQQQEIVFYVLVSAGQKRASREACNLASALMRKLLDNRWGIDSKCIGAPERFSASPAFFTQGDKGKSYEAWEVRFWQLIKYGESKWPDPVVGASVIALAINPQNPDSPDEYHEIPVNES